MGIFLFNPFKVHLLCLLMQNSLLGAERAIQIQWWHLMAKWTDYRSRGGRSAPQPSSYRSLSIPLLCPPPPPQGLTPSHTHSMHALCHPPWPWHQWQPPEHFFYMDAPKARALPNNYFPGNIRLCSVSVVQPECYANQLCARMDLTLHAILSENSTTGQFAH